MSHGYKLVTLEEKTNDACQVDNILIEREKVKVEQIINRYFFTYAPWHKIFILD